MTYDLRLGSCLDPVSGLASLADKSVDVVITDPPYEAEAHTHQRRQKGKATRPGGGDEFRAVNNAALTFPPITAADRAEVAAHIGRVTRGFAIVFCQVEAVHEWRRDLNAGGMTYRRTIPWTKPDAMPSLHGRWPGQAFESIVTASNHDEPEWEALVLASAKGAQPCPLGGKAIEYRFARDVFKGGAPHQTTKPLDLMLKLVEHFSRPGDLVVDAFAGSATTLLACRQLGRHAIGWEIDPGAHATALRRLRGEEAKPRPEQPSLFGGGL